MDKLENARQVIECLLIDFMSTFADEIGDHKLREEMEALGEEYWAELIYTDRKILVQLGQKYWEEHPPQIKQPGDHRHYQAGAFAKSCWMIKIALEKFSVSIADASACHPESAPNKTAV